MVRLDVNPPQPVCDDVIDDVKWPPTNLYSDEPPLETDFHRDQIDLLIRLLKYLTFPVISYFQKTHTECYV